MPKLPGDYSFAIASASKNDDLCYSACNGYLLRIMRLVPDKGIVCFKKSWQHFSRDGVIHVMDDTIGVIVCNCRVSQGITIVSFVEQDNTDKIYFVVYGQFDEYLYVNAAKHYVTAILNAGVFMTVSDLFDVYIHAFYDAPVTGSFCSRALIINEGNATWWYPVKRLEDIKKVTEGRMIRR